MKIFVNALSLKPQMGGGLTFGLNLARVLSQYGQGHTVCLFGGAHNADLLATVGCEVVSLGAGIESPFRRIFAERRIIPGRLSSLGADVFVSLDGTLPSRIPCPSVAVLQNLIYFHTATTLRGQGIPLRYQAYARLQASYFRSSWRRAAKHADCCLCVSNTTREEFVRHYPAMSDKAVVIYEPLHESFRPGPEPDLGAPYVLAVGTLYPNKRFDHLIHVLAELKDRTNLSLRIVGSDWGGQKARLASLAASLGVSDRVHFLGFMDNLSIVPLYQRALCLALFSETEAHPVPVAEALSCGTPPIVADRSGMAELGGAAALRVDPERPAEAAAWIRRLLDEPRFRDERRALAQKEGEKFSSHAVAEQWWAMLQQVSRRAHVTDSAAAPSRAATDRLESTYRHLPLPLQQVAVNLAGLRNRRTRFGADFRNELAFLERSEMLPADQIHALQADRLGKLVRTAYEHVPYYRELLRSRGLTPADFRTPEDLRKLPVLEKATVAANARAMVNQTLAPRERIPGHTSGSTGTSLALVHDARALAAEFATVWRMRRRFGCDLDGWHATFAGRLFVPVTQTRPPYHRVNYVQKQLLFSLYHLSPATVRHYADALGKRACDFYTGYPSALEVLVRHAEEAGVELPGPNRAVFTSSETLLARQKTSLERALGAPVHDRYGCAEFCVSFTACERGRYHLDSEFSIVEWEPLEENDLSVTGALICTGLCNHAMPFLRYRVGDVATIAKTPCSCGRESLSALSIDGRREDFVVTADGVRLGRLDHIFKDLHTIRESQILQSEPGRITIRVVRGPEYRPPDLEHLLAECRKRMGESMAIRVEYTDAIARNAAGKFRAVINTMKDAQRYDS